VNIFRFDPETGTKIQRYGSSGFLLTRVAHLFEDAMIQCAYLEPHGLIGYHQATVSQLLLVLQGTGWVRGESPERKQIQAGQGAYWEAGEWHETGTKTGMTALIIEAPDLNPLAWTPLE
jgi:quercetin dioxygenase-like cupin family protein